MNCKDCLHEESCRYYLDFDECKNFKDKSLFVELPCKVGDTVFVIVNSYTPRYASIAAAPFVVSLYDSIGKTVFLTREQADEALEERKKDNGI